MVTLFKSIVFIVATVTMFIGLVSAATANQNGVQDQSALMNIWNYKISRKIKTSIKYKEKHLAVWEEVEITGNSTTGRHYYVTPPVTLIPNSVSCQQIPITNAFVVTYDIQLWEKDLPSAAVAALKQFSLVIREDQIHPLPFYQARIIWNNPEEQLQLLTLSTAWINNLQQQQVYTFRVTAVNNASCQMLADTIKHNPKDFSDSLQLQFTVSGAKIDSKTVTVTSEHVASAQLAAALKNLPGAEGPNRYLTLSDYNRFLWQIANQVVASEVVSGDYVDADDELSLKNVIAQMFLTQKENSAQFDNNSWSSVFWDPANARPDLITKELNKYFSYNQTDQRFYRTGTASSSTSGSVSVIDMFDADASHSSQSSFTNDNIHHFLHKNNIESEILGNKFVPKKLNLVRLNVNDLSRRDLLMTTRIRVRQVEISGVLQVGVGNASRDSLHDENRYLRQQLTDIQSVLKNLQSMSSQQQQLIYQLQTNSNGLRSDITTLKDQAKHIHVDQCVTQKIPPPLDRISCGYSYSCPDGKYLRTASYAWYPICGDVHFHTSTVVCC